MLLWRIEPSQSRVPHLTQLATGLSLHVRYAPLTTVLMQIGEQQQAYLSSPGCSGCTIGRCESTCRMMMLRRTLIKSEIASNIRPVTLGLAPRPYTRLAVAIPRPNAQPLQACMIEPWKDARLWASWRTVWGQRIVGAALAVGADGPDPAEVLRAYGWRSGSIPARIVLQPTSRVLDLPFGWMWPDAPQLLVPRHLTSGAATGTPDRSQTIVTPPPLRPLLPTDADTPVSLDQENEPIPIVRNGQIVAYLTAALIATGVSLLRSIDAEERSTSRPGVRPAPQPTPPTSHAPVESTEPDETPAPSPIHVQAEQQPTEPSRMAARRRRWTHSQPNSATPVAETSAVAEQPVREDETEETADRPLSLEPDCETTPEQGDTEVERPLSLEPDVQPVTQQEPFAEPLDCAATPATAEVEPVTIEAEPATEPEKNTAEADRPLSLEPEAQPATDHDTEEQTDQAQPADQTQPQAASERATAEATRPLSPELEQPILWPEGAGLSADALEHIVRSIVANPVFTTGRQFGLSPRMLTRHVFIRLSEAQAFLAWLELAGLLEPPRNMRHIWNHPRPLITLDLAEIAARLRATTPPTSQEIAEAFAVRK